MLAVIQGIIRHLMTFGGGYLIDKDLTSMTEWEGVIAAVVSVAGILWSVYEKNK